MLGGALTCARWRRGPRAARCRSYVPAIVELCKAAGFDLIIVETPGIGQGDAAIVRLADLSLYVMTPEFGAASQLEKIDMLDLADLVAINKFDRKGGEDALRDVRKQLQRNRKAFRHGAREHAGLRHDRLALQRRRGDGALPRTAGGRWPERGFAQPQVAAADAGGPGVLGAARPSCRRRARAISPRSPRRCAATTPQRAEQARLAREAQQLRPRGAAVDRVRRRRRARRRSWRPSGRMRARPARAPAPRDMADDEGEPTTATNTS